VDRHPSSARHLAQTLFELPEGIRVHAPIIVSASHLISIMNALSFGRTSRQVAHNWSRAWQAVEGPAPDVTISAQGGGSFSLSAEAVVGVIGWCHETYQRSKLPDVAMGRGDEELVAGLATKVLTHRLLTTWVGGNTYQEADLLGVIERVLLDQGQTGAATVLVQRLNEVRPDTSSTIGTRLIRRNGDIVPWSRSKIVVSVSRALVSAGLPSSYAGFAEKVADAVGARVTQDGAGHIHTEAVQNLVEQVMAQVWATLSPGDTLLWSAIRGYMTFRTERDEARNSTPVLSDEEKLRIAAEAAEPDDTLLQIVQLTVIEPDGTTGFWDGADLRARIKFAATGLSLNLRTDEIETALRASLYEGMKRSDIQITVNLNAKTLIEKDADFAKFAGRIQMSYIYEEVLGWDILRDGVKALKRFHQEQFVVSIKRAIEIERLNSEALTYNLLSLAEVLTPENDLGFDFLGVQTLYDRYLIIDKTGESHRRIETPQFFWLRVAMGLFLRETKNREQCVKDFYRMVSERRFCPSTPTLFNSMTPHSQLSSCYLYVVDDDLGSIFTRGIAENAQLSKWAGGLGGSWTKVRGTGAHIKGTNGESQGVIPFLKIHNDQLVAVNQGGKRKGSGCAYLETWHTDILEFLELRRNVGDDRRRTHDMNTANWVPDLFMKRMEARQHWTLFRSNEVPDLHEIYGRKFEDAYVRYEALAAEGKIYGHRIEALELWKKMLQMLFETGHPWITFKDPCNVRSPQDHVGVIHSSNLCTEICLNTSKEETAVCNLGSVILCNHLNADGSLDLPKLRETIRMAMRGLDNVIDLNFYPTDAARTANLRHRPVGLGVMGLAEALYIKGMAFASQDAVEFNDEFMEAIAFYAYEASSDLAGERGAYSSYQGSKWARGILPQDTLDILEQERGVKIDVPRGGKMDWANLRAKIATQGMRNSNCLAIAPTATISNITGCSPCIEPTYKNLFVKSNLSGDFTVLNPFLVRDLKSRNLWTPEVADALKYHDGDLNAIGAIPADLKMKYLTAFDIDNAWVIDAAARRQKWIDQAQSLNFWLKTPDLKILSHLYRRLWASGAKTSYYLRTLGASNVEKSTVAVAKEKRGFVGQETIAPTPEPAAKRTYTADEKAACSIESQRAGVSCEACQ